MPYSFRPPGLGLASKTVTSWPCRRESVGAGQGRRGRRRRPRCACRSRGARMKGCELALPSSQARRVALQRADIDGHASCALRTQARSHRISVGQTRAQVPPKMFSSRIVCAAPLKIAGGDGADEAGDVDAGGAGCDAGRIVAEITAIRLDQPPGPASAADARHRTSPGAVPGVGDAGRVLVMRSFRCGAAILDQS